MDSFLGFTLILGGISYLGLLGLILLDEKINNISAKKMINSINNILVVFVIICGVIFVLTIVVAILNEPSAYEKCMESVKNQIDPQAIAWMEEYCATNS